MLVGCSLLGGLLLALVSLGLASPSALLLHQIAPSCSTVNATHLPCISRNNCSSRQNGEGCTYMVSLPPNNSEVFHTVSHSATPSNLEKWGLGVLSVGVISLSGVFGALLWPVMDSPFYKHLMRALIGLAVGSLTGTALFQLIPEGFRMKELEGNYDFLNTAVLTWLSIWLVYVIEALAKITFSHSHKDESELEYVKKTVKGDSIREVELNNVLLIKEHEQKESEAVKKVIQPVAWMIIFGDGIHNFIDGMTIGAGFSLNVATGLSMSLAIICEEFPHELGDFAILVQSGMSIKRALLYNFVSACTAFLGLGLGIALGELEGSHFIFAFAGGLFLYISLTHLMPELQRAIKDELEVSRTSAFIAFLLQNVGILLGTTVLYFITKYNDDITIAV